MLTLHDLSFERNNCYLLHGIQSHLNPGELLQVCGANGSGKSTLLRILAGLIEIQQGAVLWNNQSIHHQRETYHQQLCYLGHQNSIKLYLTVYENLILNGALFKCGTAKINSILEILHLTQKTHTQARFLSAGQLRRLALARLLLKPAKLWILDEPFTALDNSGQQWLMHLITEHLKKSGMVILATHQHADFGQKTKTLFLGETHG